MKPALTKLIEEKVPGPLVMQILLEDELGGQAPCPAPAEKGPAARMRRYRARKILYRQLLKARSLGLPISDAVELLHAAWQAKPSAECPHRNAHALRS